MLLNVHDTAQRTLSRLNEARAAGAASCVRAASGFTVADAAQVTRAIILEERAYCALWMHTITLNTVGDSDRCNFATQHPAAVGKEAQGSG